MSRAENTEVHVVNDHSLLLVWIVGGSTIYNGRDVSFRTAGSLNIAKELRSYILFAVESIRWSNGTAARGGWLCRPVSRQTK
jgi:hypothetical protein